MKIIVAGSAGFCFGVRRAVSICEKAASEYTNCVSLGPIIHNDQVVSDLKEKGIDPVSDISEIPQGSAVIIRSHGIGKSLYDRLESMGHIIIDATCPYVRRIHNIVREETANGRIPIIIGQRSHPEIIAIADQCGCHEVFETTNELSNWLFIDDNAAKPLSFVFQTTNTKSVFESCVKIIKKVCTNHKIFDTICDATYKRQQEAEDIAKKSDIMIVIGDKNSANSLKLAEICKQFREDVYFIENADGITGLDLRGIVGITAGASTPKCIIKEVINKMSEENRVEDMELPEETREETVASKDDLTAGAAEASIEQVTDAQPEAAEAKQPQPEAAEVKQAEPESKDKTVAESVPEEPSGEAVSVDSAVPEPASQALPEENPDDTTVDADTSMGDESFEEMLEKSIKTLRTGEKVTGVITSVTATEVSVELGTKQSGYIPISEFIENSDADIEDVIKIGDSIEAFVMRVNDVEGMVMLSKKRLDAIKHWSDIEDAKNSKTVVEGIVSEENKGGVVVNVKGVRVFVPASQTGLPKSAPMSDLLKHTVKLRITEVNQSRRRVVGSIRAVRLDERREKAEKIWTDIEVGKQYSGVVKSMTTYGVFVDIGGIDGMIHISELSWTRVKQPSEVLSVGDEVDVYILSFDRETRKISLGYKKLGDNPWVKFTSQYNVGDVANVKIVKMMPFGAFAEICPGVDGLIHISQIADHRIGLPSEVLHDGQMVDVKITEIDNDRKKISLSIRALIAPSSQPLTQEQIAEAAIEDSTPVIVYDTDNPPPPEPEDDDDDAPADEPASAPVEVEETPVADAEPEVVAEPEPAEDDSPADDSADTK